MSEVQYCAYCETPILKETERISIGPGTILQLGKPPQPHGGVTVIKYVCPNEGCRRVYNREIVKGV